MNNCKIIQFVELSFVDHLLGLTNVDQLTLFCKLKSNYGRCETMENSCGIPFQKVFSVPDTVLSGPFIRTGITRGMKNKLPKEPPNVITLEQTKTDKIRLE
jgi:hypothetical protein